MRGWIWAVALPVLLVGGAVAASILTTASGEGQTLVAGRYPTGLLVDSAARRLYISRATQPLGGGGGEIDVLDSRSGQPRARVYMAGLPAVVALLPRGMGAIAQDQITGALFAVGPDGQARGPVSIQAGVVDWTNSMSVNVFLSSSGVQAGSIRFRITNGQLERIVSGRPPRPIPLGWTPLTLLADPAAHRLLVFGNAQVGLPEAPSDPGLCAILHPRTGRILRSVVIGIGEWVPTLDRPLHRVFVANAGSGTVTILDSRTGARLRTVTVGPNPAAVAVDERHRRIVVALGGTRVCPNLYCSGSYWAGDGSVVALAADGALLHTWHTGGMLRAVAVDPATGHIFGLDMGGREARHPTWLPAWLARWLPTTPQPSTGRLLMLSGD